jgi:DNA-binding NarL/FixJ family response regulator
MRRPIAVVILDADSTFRQQVRAWLESAGDIVVAGQAGSEAEVQEQMLSHPSPVLLADLETLGGPQRVSRLGARFPGIRLIVLHGAAEASYLLEALQQGAQGHLARAGLRPEEVVEAVRTVARGEAFLSPTVAGWVAGEVARRQGNRPGERGAQEVTDETSSCAQKAERQSEEV